jgi:hypothetical protein
MLAGTPKRERTFRPKKSLSGVSGTAGHGPAKSGPLAWFHSKLRSTR